MAYCKAGAVVRALPAAMRPVAPTVTTAISQCPNTTTAMENTRRKSAYRSRVSGVAAASERALRGLVVVMAPTLAARGPPALWGATRRR